MLRSTHCLAMFPGTSWVRPLVFGTLTTCLTFATPPFTSTAALGQGAPASDRPDLNATPVVVNGRISRPTLQPGSQGDAVIELQSVLILLGYYSGPLSGVYQDNTRTAVQQFQADAGINPDGIVGPATWNSLFPAPPAEANPPGTASTSTPQQGASAPGAPGAQSQTSQPAAETSQPVTSPSATGATTQGASTSRPVLRVGDQGEAVRQLQARLRTLGIYNGPVDGIFGPLTESAVRQVQSDNSLTVDGIVGPATWGVID
jgi:peptidoglycan hydrolase-like protein with peptidoglycan-binding domain